MPEVTPYRYLPWDSEFFGARIGRLIPTRISPSIVGETLDWCERDRIDCLYFLADPADLATVGLAEVNGFRLVDVRMTLEAASRPVRSVAPEIRAYRLADAEALRTIVRGAHTDSRFFADGRFDRDKCGELYDRWFLRDLGRTDGTVLVAEVARDAAGYITASADADRAEIGLLGVGESARGRGLGLQLVEAVLGWAAERTTPLVTVVTQGRNTTAQRLYQRAGFVPRSMELWYHRWFDHPKPTTRDTVAN